MNFKIYVQIQGTVVVANLTLMFTDEEFWGDPTVFRPERFLDKSGEIIPHCAERVLTIFGFGKEITVDSFTVEQNFV